VRESEIGSQALVMELYVVHAIRSLELAYDGQELRPKYARPIINKLANSSENFIINNKFISKRLAKKKKRKDINRARWTFW
jgi:hypothetical protein